ncbi:bifunctional hydroxymethylpyrimidine kinase/phosphomethylpyrimidine kinase [Myxococcus sp. MISCRS1]|uniref:bifunctional hydroxymethylpyrimidine kinase/phosphomethylpyrimidine kinase n=1 Tax=Myxococcus TaxID=32 RepID=UPI001CBD47B5|nr:MULTISPECIES: bifunctional hydroxymethylpyrimidine kinase/phosphomethylpyrimidine kinase [unclassified Myxococcus]MBZ4407251.1 bifunctional hydroxymethylpyrimidine kinase/phosphomethylpyrimidine kinase [Myxococcus sp. XM-1-1-1]MCY1002454.1 bifunctional hydroxymethylpyrimidine kinase/phosphomethylpyrimidine kinase [Myxococcus sp. MISCRS1]
MRPMETPKRVPTALTIAGSDSGGGAGIQADLNTFSYHRVHGTTALTAVTAQNTRGVTRVDVLPAASVAAQVDAVIDDLGVGAVKTGMLVNAEIISVVAWRLKALKPGPLVVDPVMVSRAGARLIDDSAVGALKEHLLPLADVVTPNRHEAQLLSGMDLQTLEDMKEAARRIHQLGPRAVLVKGGGMSGELRGLDVWFDGERMETLFLRSVKTHNTHGTGCTLSAAIAAWMALGQAPFEATRRAKTFVTSALEHPLPLGQGHGPFSHFSPLEPS